jgi:hypothetical protein
MYKEELVSGVCGDSHFSCSSLPQQALLQQIEDGKRQER